MCSKKQEKMEKIDFLKAWEFYQKTKLYSKKKKKKNQIESQQWSLERNVYFILINMEYWLFVKSYIMLLYK